MNRLKSSTLILTVAVAALAAPASLRAQGDPAPRGGAGTNLPGVNGAAAAAAAEARLANPVINTPPVTTTPAGAPNTADVRTNLREATREGPASPFEMHRRLEAIREGRAMGSDGAAAGSWYSRPGGAATVAEVGIPTTGSGVISTNALGDDVNARETNWFERCGQYFAGMHESGVFRAFGDVPIETVPLYVAQGAIGNNPSLVNRMSRAGCGTDSNRLSSAWTDRYYWGGAYGTASVGNSGRDGGYSRSYANGGLKLDVKPTDARVYVDGFYAGQVADFDGQIRRLPLNPGTHRVEFVANGLEPIVIAAEVADGQTATFSGQLTRKK